MDSAELARYLSKLDSAKAAKPARIMSVNWKTDVDYDLNVHASDLDSSVSLADRIKWDGLSYWGSMAGWRENLLSNPSFEDGDPLTGWTEEGAGGILTRSSVQKKFGNYSALLARHGGDCNFYQLVSSLVAGQSYTLSGWVWASVANRARLVLYDGTGYGSSFHTGSSLWEWLTVTVPVLAGNYCYNYGSVSVGDTEAYFDGFVFAHP